MAVKFGQNQSKAVRVNALMLLSAFIGPIELVMLGKCLLWMVFKKITIGQSLHWRCFAIDLYGFGVRQIGANHGFAVLSMAA